jgi:DNA-binding beta-propeller fold protein YncE
MSKMSTFRKSTRLELAVVVLLVLASNVTAQEYVIPIPVLFTIGVNSVTNRIYASGDPVVYIIDGETNEVIDSIVTNAVAFNIAINENTNRIYLPDVLTHQLLVIDGVTNTIVAAIPLDLGPAGLAIDTDHNLIYVSVNHDIYSSEITVIDGVDNTIKAQIPLATLGVGQIALNPITHRLYAVRNTGGLWIIDTEANAVIDLVPTVDDVISVDVNTFTNRIYATTITTQPSILYTIDGATNTVVDTLVIENYAVSIAVNSELDMIYVLTNGTSNNTGALVKVDGISNTIVETVSAGEDPISIDINPLTSRIYIATIGIPDSTNYSVSASAQEPLTTRPLEGSVLASPSGDSLLVFQDILPALLVPEQNYFSTSTPLLTWNRVTWATQYQVQVDRNSRFSTPFVLNRRLSASVLSVETPELSTGRYYWRVRAQKPDQTWGSWSAVESFIVRLN